MAAIDMQLHSNDLLIVSTTECYVQPQQKVGTMPRMGRPRTRVSASSERQSFGARLTALREAYGREIGKPDLSMKDFAQLLGLQEETYRRYERAETEPSLKTLSAIRRVTGVSLNSLVAGEVHRAA